MKMVALIGPKRAGKDTVASILRVLWEGMHAKPTVAVVHLADELRWRCPQRQDETKEEYRVRLQEFGREMREHHQDEGWLVGSALAGYKPLKKDRGSLVVIADVRKHAEVDRIRKDWPEAVVVKVLAKATIRRDRSDDPDRFVTKDQDSTETEAAAHADYDYLISNNGDMIDLFRATLHIYRGCRL